MSRQRPTRPWLATVRRYAFFIAAANLVWETLHVPLYTIWRDGTWADVAFAVLHCTLGDLLVALVCLVTALIVAGDASWPTARSRRVLLVAVVLGAAYTVYSEWVNVVQRRSWTYTERMPLVPPLGTGLSPLLQWLVLPPLGLWWTQRARR